MTGATLFFKDLTRVEQLEERERLRDRLAALGEMAAAIAHEVKNPLAGIEVMAGTAEASARRTPRMRRRSSPTSSRKPRWPTPSSSRCSSSCGRSGCRSSTCRSATRSRDAVSLSEGHGLRGQVAIDASLPADLPAIQGDPHQLRQIFTNLLINAYEALNGHGTVRIAAATLPEEDLPGGSENVSGPTVLVEVIDDGPGMAPEVVDRIFSPFFTTKPQGSGLGLAIVRKIVDAHDGRIDVNSAAGTGDDIPRHAAGDREPRVVQVMAFRVQGFQGSRVQGSRF